MIEFLHVVSLLTGFYVALQFCNILTAFKLHHRECNVQAVSEKNVNLNFSWIKYNQPGVASTLKNVTAENTLSPLLNFRYYSELSLRWTPFEPALHVCVHLKEMSIF